MTNDFNKLTGKDGVKAEHGKKFELEKDDEKWRAEELSVTADKQLVDSGTGDKYSIRTFSFKFHPDIMSGKRKLPTKQELFNAHLKQLEVEVWKDGMGIEKHQQPQLKWELDPLTGKATGYVIGLLCGVSRSGGETMTLQEILK